MTAKRWLETMAEIEARIAAIYERFAAEFHDVSDVGDLWVSMGREELRHAEHLSCAAGAAPESAVPASVAEHVAKLEAVVGHQERELARAVSLQEALRATADVEEAEAEHLHAPLSTLGGWAEALAANPVMQHRERHLLEHAIRLFGTPGLQERLAWQRFRG